MDGSESLHVRNDREAPSAIDLPTGCVFHGRCLVVKKVRETDIPPLCEVVGK